MDTREPQPEPDEDQPEEAAENWDIPCCVCGAKPTVGETRLCGPCCFGEADTLNGNWQQ